ncbi:Octopamine receptor beta-3R [Holothuria leucospilota]|uniref:Octopamine receptor beta-3R n=1 Tax=Holothuria leucospilota TaxID=206669 RepID=A0A9Q1HJJ8_HOLLE|nr:Octopamine receptor beta-3R [Holothuria leucospilota]
MVIVMGAFVICWTPSIFKLLFAVYGSYSVKTLDVIQVSAEILSVANSTVNPIIYGYRNSSFRAAYKNVITKYCSCIFRKNTANLKCDAKVTEQSCLDFEVSKISTSAM